MIIKSMSRYMEKHKTCLPLHLPHHYPKWTVRMVIKQKSPNILLDCLMTKTTRPFVGSRVVLTLCNTKPHSRQTSIMLLFDESFDGSRACTSCVSLLTIFSGPSMFPLGGGVLPYDDLPDGSRVMHTSCPLL
jgi:hypothetical protein